MASTVDGKDQGVRLSEIPPRPYTPLPGGNEKIPNVPREKEQVSGEAPSLRSLGLTRKAGGWKATGKCLQMREEGAVSHMPVWS